MYLVYMLYLKPWGDRQIQEGLSTSGLDRNSSSINCSGCLLGVNTQFPTNTTGLYHALDTYSGQAGTAMVCLT